jgi:hypothetical protein
MIVELCGLFMLFNQADGQLKDVPALRYQDVYPTKLTGSLHYDISMNADKDFPADSISNNPFAVNKIRYSPLTAGLFQLLYLARDNCIRERTGRVLRSLAQKS